MSEAALGSTPAQTVGPYLAIVLPWPDGPDVVSPATPDAITVTGRLTDGAGEPVPDGLLEIWQADPAGRFAHPDDPRGPATWPGFRGFGRCATDADGRFGFRTLKPGPLPDGDGGTEAPHLNVSVFARGLLSRVVTRVYFPDETAANAVDPVLVAVGPERAARLIARPGPDGGLVFDLRLQGAQETPFFDV
ncbi:MAG: protocatechuate 3,4-dioxygenase subunit alpha [Geodermatophilaceae bacterium]|nr:protocatechuate 3,4-dioxygenase subunit alpha [Geodermatophilaceae bacterium]